ncbi:MAG TPA: S49 family peptidase [Gammaproteobacteria bacterium]|nr:S49 family peptidase [Gammaproteobacteria bacterium]
MQKPPSSPNDPHGPDWERATLRELLLEQVREQRNARRWSTAFRLLIVAYLFAVLFYAQPQGFTWPGAIAQPHTALVEVQGVIAPEFDANADSVVTGLRAAFEDTNTRGVIIRINSPGGSPVQSGYINDEIMRLRDKHPDIPVYAVISDICASGGYYIAAAADQIWADKASIVGSIGVRMDGFGFVDAIGKLGVERRLHTAGENKAFLDPFLPQNPAEVSHVDGLLDSIHQQFINTVKRGRGERLKDDPRLFTGLFWTGEQSLELGLIDGLGSASHVARELIGAEEIVDFTPRRTLFEELGVGLGTAAMQLLQPGIRLR